MSYDIHPALNEEPPLTDRRAPQGKFRVIAISLAPQPKDYWISIFITVTENVCTKRKVSNEPKLKRPDYLVRSFLLNIIVFYSILILFGGFA